MLSVLNLNTLIVITLVLGIWTSLNTCVFVDQGKNKDIYKTKSKTSPDEQALAVKQLVKRLIPQRVGDFLIDVDASLAPPGRDAFQLQNVSGKIQITGSTGYAAASGFHYYLKYFCGCHISWSGDQLQLPYKLPPVRLVKIIFNDRFRYYQNVCTASYSTVWWNWTRWEREIDWMALNGINLPLAFTGQEWIWQKVFKSFNFTDNDINEFFTGPAFLAWNRMGNIQLWAGPLSYRWHYHQKLLQHKILDRMRAFGMTPVLPAFSGRVPPSILRIYPNAKVSILSKDWGHFNPPYGSVLFLEPTDPLFERIGSDFLQKYIQEFGSDHFYNVDLFNEMKPPNTNPKYLAECSKSVFQKMQAVDSKAIWLLQGWMFYNDPTTWQPSQVKAFVTSVPQGRMIILDLQAELFPQYQKFNSYYGQPFIWCMLHNYGGVSGLYGSLEQINKGPFEGRNYTSSTMIGTGITPEGIETNDVVYELMNEMGWRKEPVNLDEWLTKYAKQRYGNVTDGLCNAWLFLKGSVYNATAAFRNHGKYILTTRPSLSMTKYVWYDEKAVFEAWHLFINASFEGYLSKSMLFQHDLVDITRQGLQLIMAAYYDTMKAVLNDKDIGGMRNVSHVIWSLYDDLEMLLASDAHFLLGRWLYAAKSWSTAPLERRQSEYNARNQITLWGPSGEILDYANKQWSGVISGYYKKRWELFLKTLIDCLQHGHKFNETSFQEQVLNIVEIPFTLGEEYHTIIPKGDPVKISQMIWKKYELLLQTI